MFAGVGEKYAKMSRGIAHTSFNAGGVDNTATTRSVRVWGRGRTGRVFATRNSFARSPRFFTTRRKYQPQNTVKTSPNAFCSGVASSSGTPMPS